MCVGRLNCHIVRVLSLRCSFDCPKGTRLSPPPLRSGQTFGLSSSCCAHCASHPSQAQGEPSVHHWSGPLRVRSCRHYAPRNRAVALRQYLLRHLRQTSVSVSKFQLSVFLNCSGLLRVRSCRFARNSLYFSHDSISSMYRSPYGEGEANRRRHAD